MIQDKRFGNGETLGFVCFAIVMESSSRVPSDSDLKRLVIESIDYTMCEGGLKSPRNDRESEAVC